jgi:hypothetical protein
VEACIVEGIAVDDDFAAEVAHGLDLDRRRRGGHDDDGTHAKARGGHGDALGVIAGGSADDAARSLFSSERGELVVGATNLEGKYRLQVFALEQNLKAEAA